MRRARRKEACVRVETPLRDELAHYLMEQTGTLEGAATVKSDSAVGSQRHSTSWKKYQRVAKSSVHAIAAPSYEGVRITPRVATQNPTHAQSRQGDSKR
jgi:hypothetical protein